MILNNDVIAACDRLFDSDLGKKVYSGILKCISDFNMTERLSKGTILGLSGGADSVLLLIFLRKFRKEHKFNLKAVHINHMIRGEDADRDEAFSRLITATLGIDFVSVCCDVPKIAAERRLGIEETARGVRYEAFASALTDGFETVVTAHNATDNLETFIFNFMRGSGLSGLTSISPVRDNIVRPLLYVSKKDVVALLSESGIPYCTDKTNLSTEYTRNYIRHEILPKLKHLASSPEEASMRAIANLRCDDEFIEKRAKQFFEEHYSPSGIRLASLAGLHRAMFSRVIRLMVGIHTNAMPEKKHYDALYDSVNGKTKRFEIDLPGNIAFLSNGEYCHIAPKGIHIEASDELCVPLGEGFTEIPELGIAIGISKGKCEDFSSNVYKFSMKADLSSAIIVDGMYLRTKKDGDAYRYGGFTRKLKKLFNDKKIPPDRRKSIPVICDGSGIVWVMGFGVRDDEPEQKIERWLTVYKKSN